MSATVKRVRVPAKWRPLDGDGIGYDHEDVAIFELGPGSCGKTVLALSVEYRKSGVTIAQCCDDGEYKSFHYPWHTVTGRIEVTHE